MFDALTREELSELADRLANLEKWDALNKVNHYLTQDGRQALYATYAEVSSLATEVHDTYMARVAA